MKKNPLSEIYTKKILLNEEKDNVVKGAKELESKIGKADLKSGQGPEEVKDLEHPEEHKKYSDGASAKTTKVEENMEQETEPKASYEGSFEKLFKATISEDLGEEIAMDIEVPTSDAEMADEINDEESESSDLVSDLRTVIDSLQSILDKLSNDESESEEDFEDEVEGLNDEGAVKEAVEAEEKGHALHNLKAGTDLMSKGKVEVKGAVKVTKGKAVSGDVESDPELKPAKSHDKSCQSPKGKPEVKSTVKAGEFFK